MRHFILTVTANEKSWYAILKENQDVFKRCPNAEILLAGLSMEKASNIKKRQLPFMLKGIVISFCSMIPWKIDRKLECDFFAESSLVSQNDWGIIKGIILELSFRGHNVLLQLSENSKRCYEQEIENKQNFEIVDFQKGELVRIHISFMRKLAIIAEWFEICRIAKRYKLCSFSEFYYTYLIKIIQAKLIKEKYLKMGASCISLGSTLMGIMHQEYGLQHFVFPHGNFTERTMQDGGMFTPSVGSTWMVWGDNMGQILKKYYNESYAVVGSTLLKKSTKRISKCYDIVFFSNPDNWDNQLYTVLLYSFWKKIALYAKKTNMRIAVKPKHTENPDVFLKYIKTFYDRDIEIINPKKSPGEVLTDCKAVVSMFNSTVALEAVINGAISFTPVIDDYITYDDGTIPYVVNDFTEIEEILSDSNKMSEIRSWQNELLKREVLLTDNPEISAVDEIERRRRRLPNGKT